MNIEKFMKYVWDNIKETGVYEELFVNDYCEYEKYYVFGGEYSPGRNLIGFKIPSYTALCELLDIEPKGGNFKKARLRELKRYFDYERMGNAYILKPIHDLTDELDFDEISAKKRPLLFYLKNGLFTSGMYEVDLKFDDIQTINSEYYTDLNEFILIDDLYNFDSKCYSENDLAKMFQYINYNFSRFTSKKEELVFRTGIKKEIIDTFFSLTKKSYSRIIKNSIARIEKNEWITVEKVLCGNTVHFSAEGIYSKSVFDDEQLSYNFDGRTFYDRVELTAEQIEIYQVCICNAIDKMRKANKNVNYNFEDEKGCKRFNYKQWMKFINEETITQMGLLYVKECYKIKLTEKAKNEYFDTIVSDTYAKSVKNLYQNISYSYKLISNTHKRLSNQMQEINYIRFWTGYEELSYEDLQKESNFNENYHAYLKLIELFISIKEEDLKKSKEILYKPIPLELIKEKQKEKDYNNQEKIKKELGEELYNTIFNLNNIEKEII